MNPYLEILDLHPGASKNEIKKAYRILSKKYHPDISVDPNAKEMFINITEAYNFLIKAGEDSYQEKPANNSDNQFHEYEIQRREARRRAKKQAEEAERLQQDLIKKILTGFVLIAVIITSFNVLLTLDYSLSRKTYQEKIVKIRKAFVSNRVKNVSAAERYRYDDVFFEHFTMRFDMGEIIPFETGDTAIVFATQLFNIPTKATFNIDGNEETHFQLYNVYKVFGYIIPAIFMCGILYRFIFTTLDQKLTLAILLLMLSLIQLYVFFKF